MARVLIVEPAAELSELLSLVVARAGHEPLAYVGAPSSLPRDVDAVLVEPDARGALALVRRLRASRPHLPIVCLSMELPTPEAAALEPVAFLDKPFAIKDVDAALEVALGGSGGDGAPAPARAGEAFSS